MQIFDRNSKNGGNKSKHPTQKRAEKDTIGRIEQVGHLFESETSL